MKRDARFDTDRQGRHGSRHRRRKWHERAEDFGPSPNKLYRDPVKGKVMGVCAGVADYFGVEVWIRSPGTLFVDSVRNDDKKEVMRIVQTDMENELAQAGVPIRYMHIGIGDIRDAIDRGAMVLLLISSWRLYEERFPHWVVVTGFGDRHVSIHDPYVDYERNRSVSDSVNLPIPIEEFARMLRYGRADQQAAVIIYPSVKEN